MKKRTGIGFVLSPLVLTSCLYAIFYPRIESTPGDAGFWFILALGMSIGVALTRFIQWLNTRKTKGK